MIRPGDPEIRVRIPIRGTATFVVKPMKDDAGINVRIGNFMASEVTLELLDSKAAQGLVEAVQQAQADLARLEASKAPQSRRKTTRTATKKGGSKK